MRNKLEADHFLSGDNTEFRRDDYEEKVSEKLEFNQIKELWSDCALTGRAKGMIEEIRPILSETELAARLRETTEARQMLEQCGTPPLISLEGIRELFAAAGKGLCLTALELEKIGMALTAVKRMKEYLCRGKSQGIPLAYYEENLDPLEELGERLRYQIWNGQVADGASRRLKSLRGDILRTEDRMREKAEGVMRSNFPPSAAVMCASPEVKTYAANQEGILNARMTFDRENLKPLYQMVIGEAGESCAFYIAARLGMPGHMLRRAAEAAYGGTDGKGGSGRGGNEDTDTDRGLRSKEGTERGGTEDKKEAGEKAALKFLEGMALQESLKKESSPHILRNRPKAAVRNKEIAFQRGDSVMVYPDKKIGIVCQPVNDKGVLRVQLPGKKIWINHKRVKLLVAAQELYPEDYDFSIVFDTAENRKLRHQMERKYVEGLEISNTSYHY